MDEQEVTVGIWPMTRSLEQSRGTGGGRLAVPCGGGISDPARKTLGVVLACRTRLVTRLGIKGGKIPSFSARLAIGCMTAQEAPHVRRGNCML